uniref:Uncharacterized protein n=1 Tax=Arundo donax TaxID=35708 RepID=A0A0A9DXN6_ARUDO
MTARHSLQHRHVQHMQNSSLSVLYSVLFYPCLLLVVCTNNIIQECISFILFFYNLV